MKILQTLEHIYYVKQLKLNPMFRPNLIIDGSNTGTSTMQNKFCIVQETVNNYFINFHLFTINPGHRICFPLTNYNINGENIIQYINKYGYTIDPILTQLINNKQLIEYTIQNKQLIINKILIELDYTTLTNITINIPGINS